jgi:hypothetical protein
LVSHFELQQRQIPRDAQYECAVTIDSRMCLKRTSFCELAFIMVDERLKAGDMHVQAEVLRQKDKPSTDISEVLRCFWKQRNNHACCRTQLVLDFEIGSEL